MKKNLLVLGFLFSIGMLPAQITVNNDVFPVPGDTFAVRNVMSGFGSIDLGSPGPNQNWDFSAIGNGTLIQTVYLDPANAQNAALFPNATAYFEIGGGIESFFERTNTSFAALGSVGGDLTGLGISDEAVFNTPYVVQRAPLTYNSGNFTAQTSITFRFSLNDLPAAIRDSVLSNVPLNIDSLGVGISLQREDDVDAWGTLKVPGGSYEVLREKRTEFRSGIMEAKVPILGWTDVTQFVQSLGGFGAIGNDTTVTYYFHNDMVKEPVAEVRMDASGQSITSISYRDGDGTVGNNNLILKEEDFQVSPNPVTHQANFSLTGLANGRYHLVLFDNNGKKVQQERFESTGDQQTISVNVSNFTAGIYFVAVLDNQGRILGTTQMIKD